MGTGEWTVMSDLAYFGALLRVSENVQPPLGPKILMDKILPPIFHLWCQ